MLASFDGTQDETPDSAASGAIAWKARWVFPVAALPIEGGVVTVRNGVLVAVGAAAEAPVVDLGDVAILPGLVNAHTHLEFSELEQPLGEPGMVFPEWIREVIAWRRQRDATEESSRERRRAAVECGLRESAALGVTALGEIAAPGWASEPFAATSLDCTIFQELLGLEPQRHEELAQLAHAHIAAGTQAQDWRPALSPHAPYTAPLALVEAAAALSQHAGAPLAMHLAESWEEIELLASGSGPFAEFLGGVAAWMPSAIPRGLRPRDYLERLAAAARALVIHGNYLDDEEIAWIAGRAERMSIVFCPRTHAYFQHGRYPLEAMLAAGARVALGTDSRASNPDLSLFEEMRFVAQRFPAVSPAAVLNMGTQAGAEALGLADHYGSLVPGRRADLAIVRLSARTAADPHELLFDDAASLSPPQSPPRQRDQFS